jgi:hypothetical protein
MALATPCQRANVPIVGDHPCGAKRERLNVFFLVWRGWGIAVVGIAVLAFFVGAWLADIFGAAGGAMLLLLGLSSAAGGVATWFIGKRLNRVPASPAATGVRARHSLFFVPFQWWGPVLVGLGALFVLSAVA